MTKRKDPKDLIDAGRPEVYTKELADELAKTLPNMFQDGESVAEVCVKLDCSKESFYKMIGISPLFSDAYKKGLDKSEAWWTTLGRAGSAGKHAIQPATWIFNMKNRFSWKDKQEITGADGNPLFSGFAEAVKNNLKPK